MSRYIDADALIDAHYEYINEHSYNANAVFPTWSLSLMQNAPSINIARCGECKYYNDDYTGEWCGRFRNPHPCKADDFCSYGEILVKTGENHEKTTRKE